jgi:non-homologous end joining protein Ku
MATSVWKGHLTFGLVSIPVKLYRAARAEKVSFRQVHEASGTRVRQALYREASPQVDGTGVEDSIETENCDNLPSMERSGRATNGTIPFAKSI